MTTSPTGASRASRLLHAASAVLGLVIALWPARHPTTTQTTQPVVRRQ